MSKLDELINELCPDGVEYKPLEYIFDILAGGDVPKECFSETRTDEFSIPILSNGIEDKSLYGWTNKAKIEKPSLTISARGTIGWTSYRDYPFYPIVRLLVITPKSEMSLKYVYHFMKSIENDYNVPKVGIPQLTKPMIQNIQIPLPPLPVQEEIARILDNFTELTAELTAELAARKKQYQYYSTLLFDHAKINDVSSIKEVCYIEKGKTPIQKAIPGEYPMVVTTTERKSCDSYQFDAKAVCIPLVSSRGHGVASLNHVYYQEGKFALGNILCALIIKNETDILPKYLYYYFEHTKDYTLVPLMKGGANVALHMNDIEKLNIPVPPLAEQQRIVDILDRFDTLCNDISSGLPAEIKARQQQYEYYRDKLLTFPKAELEV